MNWKLIGALLLLYQSLAFASSDLTSLKKDQRLAEFRVDHLYSDSEGRIVGAKFLHIPTGAPVFVLQLATAPQVFTWVESPADSNRGLPHALEHLLLLKGAKGRYLNLLEGLRLSNGSAATSRDFVYYGLSSGSGVDSFFEQFHVLMDALYHPDFTDVEAEREFYHFTVANAGGGKKTLIESGTVYREMLSNENRYEYVFELSKRALGKQSPFGFDSGGIPEEMRMVTPNEIRLFHDKYYRLGPGTGFIFSFPPRESLPLLLQRISQEFEPFAKPQAGTGQSVTDKPKYPIHPSADLDPGIYPFPGPNETAPGFVHFAWAPAKIDSLLDLRMLELFSHALAGGEGSLLHKAVVDSEKQAIDLGATGVDSELFMANSPYYPVVIVEASGMPGNRISSENLRQLRAVVLSKISEVSKYPDQSETLRRFNSTVLSYAKSLRRSKDVWAKNPPGFGNYPPRIAWKAYLDGLETDPSFVRSLSQTQEWQTIEQQLGSGKNVWRGLIDKFHLLDAPYVTATAPSPKLLEDIERKKQDRIQKKIRDLMERYHTENAQEALSMFEQDESAKTRKIDEVEAKVPRPSFTDHPPLVQDEDLQYSRFQLGGVPVIASVFNRPPTIDIGISFDLRKIPRQYYRYLPLLPKCLDSLGLRNRDQVVPYSELLAKIQETVFAFSTGYETDPVSKRADLTIRASAANVQEFREALKLIQQLMKFNDLDLANADRVRDIVARRISTDNWYAKQDYSTENAGSAFRFQDDRLYLALSSEFTGIHLDNRLKWLLHQPANSEEIERLEKFAREVLPSTPIASKKEIAQKLDSLHVTGLEKELVEYWRINFSSFPEGELADGFRRLAAEVVADLKTGPAKAIEDLRTLQKLILNRRALRLDLTLSQADLGEIRNDLARFVQSIPDRPFEQESELHEAEGPPAPLMTRLQKQGGLSLGPAPWYVGFENPNRTGGDVTFYADFPDYSQLDRKSLVQVLASTLFAGAGPQSFQMKTLARGLAYHNYIFSDPGTKRISYYADRSPDVPSLLEFVNETASTVSQLKDPSLVDYAFSYIFNFSRATSTFAERGKAAAQDIRDGNEPEKVRRFSEAVLKLRKNPNLLSELSHTGLASICGVLVRDDCSEQHHGQRSLFFFVGSEQVLSDIEKRVRLPQLLKLYPSDYWIDFSGDPKQAPPANVQ